MEVAITKMYGKPAVGQVLVLGFVYPEEHEDIVVTLFTWLPDLM